MLLWSLSWNVSVIGPVMPLYVRSLGINVIEWSVLAMSWAVGMVIFEWMWGIMSDRINRQIFLIVSMLGMTVLFPLYTIEGLVPYFFILQFLFGAFVAIPGPVTRALVQDASSTKSIGFSMSLWSVCMTLGSIVGPLMGSYIAQTWAFRYSFYLSALISLTGVIAISIGLRKNTGRRPVAERNNSKKIMNELKTVIRIPSIWILFLLAFFTFMVISAVKSFLPIYASAYVGLSTVEVGLVAASTSTTQLMITPLFGWFSDRVGRKRLIAASLVVSSIVLLSYLLVRTPSQLLLVSVGASMCFSTSPLFLAILFDIIPNQLRGMVIGIYGSFEDLGLLIGPLLYGLIWSLYTPVLVFVVSAAIQALSIPLILLVGRKSRG